jgi:hypothetical protein
MPPAKFSRGTAKGRARVNKALKLADVAAARSHNANMSGTTHAHAQAASAHQHAAEAHRAAGSYEQAKVHDALAAEHSAKADRGNVSGKTHPPTRGTTNGFPSKHGNKPFSNTHDQHAATANARNATAQAHAREGSSDKHLAASDHRIAATAHGNAANKYMYGSKEYQSHVASADYHQGKARELDARSTSIAAGESHRGSPTEEQRLAARRDIRHNLATERAAKTAARDARNLVSHAPGSSTSKPTTPHEISADVHAHAAAASARAHAKPSLVSHSLAAKAHEKAAAQGVHTNEHLRQAEHHRLEARKHSLKALAARKIGPGQKHGFHGQFEGVPGGAK